MAQVFFDSFVSGAAPADENLRDHTANTSHEWRSDSFANVDWVVDGTLNIVRPSSAALQGTHKVLAPGGAAVFETPRNCRIRYQYARDSTGFSGPGVGFRCSNNTGNQTWGYTVDVSSGNQLRVLEYANGDDIEANIGAAVTGIVGSGVGNGPIFVQIDLAGDSVTVSGWTDAYEGSSAIGTPLNFSDAAQINTPVNQNAILFAHFSAEVQTRFLELEVDDGAAGPVAAIDSVTPTSITVDAQLTTTDTSDGSYWAGVWPTGTSGLDHDDVKNGTGAVSAIGPIAVPASSPFAMQTITGLNENTPYELFVTQELADTTPQATPSTQSFTTTIPVIGAVDATAGGQPTDTALPLGATASNITVAAGGSVWFAVYEASAPDPQPADIIAGTGTGKAGAPPNQQFGLVGDPASAATTQAFTGLNSDTSYKLWVAVQDAAGGDAVPVSDTFQTAAAPTEVRFVVRDETGNPRTNLTNVQYAMYLAPSDLGTWDPGGPAPLRSNTGTTDGAGELVVPATGVFNDGVSVLVVLWKQDETPDWTNMGIETASFV